MRRRVRVARTRKEEAREHRTYAKPTVAAGQRGFKALALHRGATPQQVKDAVSSHSVVARFCNHTFCNHASGRHCACDLLRCRLRQVTGSNFSFQVEDYKLVFDFFGAVDSEASFWKIGARDVAFVFMREQPGDYWDKLYKGLRLTELSAMMSHNLF